MRHFILPVLLLGLILGITSWALPKKKNKAPKKFTVSGQLLETYDYCGGARPTEEVLEDARTPRPVAFRTFYLKKGTVNGKAAIIDSIVSDSLGNFSIRLEAGVYCLVEKKKTLPYVVPNDDDNWKYDTACHRKNFYSCDHQLEVTKNSSGYKIVTHRSCQWRQPCATYLGPKPPASRPPGRSGQPGHQE